MLTHDFPDNPLPRTPQVHSYVSTGLASSKFGIRNSHIKVACRHMRV